MSLTMQEQVEAEVEAMVGDRVLTEDPERQWERTGEKSMRSNRDEPVKEAIGIAYCLDQLNWHERTLLAHVGSRSRTVACREYCQHYRPDPSVTTVDVSTARVDGEVEPCRVDSFLCLQNQGGYYLKPTDPA